MERVLTHPSLVKCLSQLSIHSSTRQRSLWVQQKRAFHRTSALIRAVGTPCLTSAHAKHLDRLGLDFEELRRLYHDYGNKEELLEVLKGRGVKSKPVREKFEGAQSVCSSEVVSSPGSLQLPTLHLAAFCVSLFFFHRLFSEPNIHRRFLLC